MSRSFLQKSVRKGREQFAFGVNYQWTGPNGAICRGHTVSTGYDRMHAEAKYFNQHKHVQPAREGEAA